MKTFLLILLSLLAFETSHAAPPKPTPTPAPTPLSEADRAKVTQQRDALLEGLVAKLVDAKGELSSAQNIHKSDTAIESKLLETTGTMAGTIESQKTQISDLKASLARWKRVVAIIGGVIALLFCLVFNVPKLAMPYGIIATCAAPVIVYGILRYIV